MITTTTFRAPRKRVGPAPTPQPTPPASATYEWPIANKAEQLLRERIDSFLERNTFAGNLARRMQVETGTDFFEWIDHLVLPPDAEDALASAGFVMEHEADTPHGEPVYVQPRTTLPRVLLRKGAVVVALRPECLADFIASHNLMMEPEGEPLSRYRRIALPVKEGTRLEAVERCAYNGFVPAALQSAETRCLLKTKELLHTRPRQFAQDAMGFKAANQILDRVIPLVGRDVACHFVFQAERAYWERRNQAARIQKHRQDALGLGWGNHDHHTFRCSRENFVSLVEFLLKLGFVKRERYYAGAEAGWGAQVLEQPITGIVVFADVDLMPEETELDFSKHRLAPASRLGTVGLWVGLHGESFLEAGLHHLEARFDFALLRDQLQASGVSTMKPFSNFPFLRQAFTEGERWPVRRERLDRLISRGLITRGQYHQFLREGALGSHLENLQRHGGFKGFNQRAVSDVITATDPRKTHFRA